MDWAFIQAIIRDEADAVAAMMQERQIGANYIDPVGRYNPLHIAVQHGSSGTYNMLLDAGVDVNIEDRTVAELPGAWTVYSTNCDSGLTPLMLASIGDATVVRDLLDRGADVNKRTWRRGMTALHYAVTHGCTDIVAELLIAGCDVNIQTHEGETPLYCAVKLNKLHEAKLLLRIQGINPNIVTTCGYNALHLINNCCAHQPLSAEIVRLLLAAMDPSAVNVTDGGGMTPIHCVLLRDRTDLFEMMLGVEGVDVRRAIPRHGTPLEIAVTRGNTAAVRALVSRLGAEDLNRATVRNRDTPLHVATRLGHVEIVKALLQAPGVMRNLRNADGLTARDLAIDFDMIAAFNPPIRMLVMREAGLLRRL